ncbi:MAG: SGNH/GDSL hydrolase family protein [Elusimicrobia bacterium]|nr:SGNH/GDSL hydrolase family protein [Elusimicrobiota bacterium]
MRHARALGLAAPLLGTLAAAVFAEAALRAAGFRYAHHPLAFRYVRTVAGIGADQRSDDRLKHIEYGLDPVLLWRPRHIPGVTNTEGVLGPDWAVPRPPQARRIIALGDSCTIAGDTPYPARLERLLKARSASWEMWNAGVGSWSSFQGRQFLEQRLALYQPTVVVVYFGWNDHWLSWSVPDKELPAHLSKRWRLLKTVEKSRLLQGFLRAADAIRPGVKFSERTPPRVSLDDYEANLRAMVRAARAGGGEALLATAPTTLSPKHPMTRILCEETRNFFDPGAINRVHDSYNDRVRAVARSEGACLADLARAFAGAPDPSGLFTDGFHLTARGHRLASELLLPEVLKAEAHACGPRSASPRRG